MDTKETISKEIISLYDEGAKLAQAFQKKDKEINFPYEYQRWYTRVLRVVEVLAPDRYVEFRSYYEIDAKRKSLGYGTYVIQDFLKGVAPNEMRYPNFDIRGQALENFFIQLTIFHSLSERVDSVLANIDSELLSDIQDAELGNAKKLMKVSIRAAGCIAGVVVENHLLKIVRNHRIGLRKKNPTINDLNTLLKNERVLDTPTWRKITYLGDIRNVCSHKKDVEPTKEQVTELIDGADWFIKNVL